MNPAQNPWKNVFGIVAFLLLSGTVQRTSAQNMAKAYIRYNQVGYLTSDRKVALALSKEPLSGQFVLQNSNTKQIVFKAPLQLSQTTPWSPFSHYYELDFSGFQTPGTYQITLENTNVPSGTFTIGRYPAYQEQLLFFMRQQRCGYNPYTDQVCHQGDGRTFFGPLKDSSYIDASGGWHDAGDQLKYLITSSNATARMLLAYEWAKDRFTDTVDDLGHAHPNGIPDVLDEAKWGLDWIHKMHPAPDQLYHQVADDRDHRGFKWPHKDNADYGWGQNSYRPVYFADGKPQGAGKYKSEATGVANLAGRCAAAMAIAARIWKNDLKDPIFAEKCAKAAIELYALGKQKEGYQQGNSYSQPYRYTEDTWADDMEWGAAELYKLTKKETYRTDAKRYARLIGTTSWMEKDTAAHYQLYPYVNVGHYALYDIADAKTKAELADYYRHNLERVTNKGLKNPYGIGTPFIWCSNNLVTAFVTQAILYERMTGDKRYRAALLAHRDWLLGRNPWGTSMFTGIPAHGDFPLDVHLPFWLFTKKVIPGGLVDGPLWETIHGKMVGLTLSEPDEFGEFQPNHVKYMDDIGDYSTNEPTMDGTADGIFMFAFFAKPGK